MLKKSQITIFVILFVVIVFIAGYIFYSNYKIRIDELKLSGDTNLKEISPVKIYIEDVIRNLLIEGMFLVGKQGGFIYYSTWPLCLEEDPSYTEDHRMCTQLGIFDYGTYPEYLGEPLTPYKYQRVHTGINDGREDTITMTSFEKLEQPFSYPHIGYYLASDYLYGMNQPLIEITGMTHPKSIEYQLSNFTENHFPFLLNFEELEKRGYDITVQEGYPRVTVKINEDDVTARVYYNVTVEKAGIRYDYDEFYVDLDYNFRRMYMFVQRLIQEDMTTLNDIKSYKILNESGDIVGEVYWAESEPETFLYDVIYVIDRSYDFDLMHNYKDPQNPEPQYMTFYFIRENRAPDASTVYYEPEGKHIQGKNQITWFCPNFQTSGEWFDPDEDDEHTEEFPFIDPQWYVWYSRGDFLETDRNDACDGFKGCPYVKSFACRNDPNSIKHGVSWEDKLDVCGNELLTSGPHESKLEDVGDLIILKVNDNMEFPVTSATAPSRYPLPPIIEFGTGRLNDAISWRPVQCDSSLYPHTCIDSTDIGIYWGFNKRPDPEEYKAEEYCTKQCTRYTFQGVECEDWNYNTQTCDKYKTICEKECFCMESWWMYKHIDHTGGLVDYNDPWKPGSINKVCVNDPECTNYPSADSQNLCNNQNYGTCN